MPVTTRARHDAAAHPAMTPSAPTDHAPARADATERPAPAASGRRKPRASRVRVRAEPSPLGALPAADGGFTVGVWAPNATAAQLWWRPASAAEGEEAHVLDMESGADGRFSARLPQARAGDAYGLRLTTPDGRALDRVDPRARAVTNSVGEGLLVDASTFDWQDVAFETPGHDDLVICELHVGTYGARAQGEPDAASPVAGFAELIERLPHLRRLGFSAIQLMPVAEFAGDRSWGYNPAHPWAVESAYGGPDGLRTLVREAHRQGLAVILDVVYNHFGPSDLQLWRFDGWPADDTPDGGGGIYFYNDDRARTPWGETRPDYGRGEVRQYIRDNALMWLEEYRLDGLRLDMTLYMRSIAGEVGDDLPDGWSLMQWLTDEIRAHHPRAVTISEDLRQLDAVTAATADGGAGFHAQWDARFVHPVRAALIAPEDAQRDMASLATAIATIDHGDAFRRVIYTESHDEVANGQARVPHEIAEDDPGEWHARRRTAAGAVMVLTAPGIPMLFQGQEFLQGGWFRDDLPLDWDQAETYRGTVRLFRDLIALRRNRDDRAPALRGHDCRILQVNQDAHLLAWSRLDSHRPDRPLVVVVNLGVQPLNGHRLGLPAAGHWRVLLNTDSRHYGDTGTDGGSAWADADGAVAWDGQPASAVLDVPACAALILALQPAG